MDPAYLLVVLTPGTKPRRAALGPIRIPGISQAPGFHQNLDISVAARGSPGHTSNRGGRGPWIPEQSPEGPRVSGAAR